MAPILEGAETPPAVRDVIGRACQNCHSEETKWPWYSYVPPVAWLVERDVHEAREHMNLSRWREYSAERQVDLLTRMGTEVRNRQMPLPKYLRIHPEARLSDADIQLIYDWARHERKRVRSAADSRP